MKHLFEYINEQLINEHFVNVFNKNEMSKYVDEIWTLLQKSYEYCGGTVGMYSPKQLIDETTMWKLVRRNNKITAGAVYNDKRGGRKICYLFSDGTEEGVNDCKKIMQEDSILPERKAWGEFSGKAVSTMFNQGAMPIRADISQEIMKDKKFIKIQPDGYYYVREIGGHLHTKLMMCNPRGKVDVPEEVRKELKALAKKYDSDYKTDQKITQLNDKDKN